MCAIVSPDSWLITANVAPLAQVTYAHIVYVTWLQAVLNYFLNFAWLQARAHCHQCISNMQVAVQYVVGVEVLQATIDAVDNVKSCGKPHTGSIRIFPQSVLSEPPYKWRTVTENHGE